MVVDRAGIVRLYNSAMERLLGFAPHEVLGSRFVESATASECAPKLRWCFDEALRGTVRRCDCELATREGERLAASLELSLVGGSGECAVLAAVLESKLLPAAPVEWEPPNLEYVVASGERMFELRHLRAGGTALPGVVGQRCYWALHRREEACAGCPALGLGPDRRTASTVIRNAPAGESFNIVQAEMIEPDAIRLRSSSITESTVAALVQARIASLSERAGLSGRQRAVLDMLLLGRSPREIATLLGISVRTVKFHQANILEKLGADSRVDLIRLLM